MEHDTSMLCCFACSELFAGGIVSCINHGEIASFLQRVGIKLPSDDIQSKLLLCSHCRESIEKFRGAFVRFVECIQDGIDQQLGSPRINDETKSKDSMSPEDSQPTGLSGKIGSVQNNQEEKADYSSFSDDSTALKLDGLEDLSDISFSDLSSDSELENPSEKFVGSSNSKVKAQVKVKKRSSPVVDESVIISDLAEHDQKSAVQRHQTPAKAYQCDRCGKLLSYEHTLRRHISEIHLRESRQACKLCHMTFARYSSLAQHMFSHHKIKSKE